VNDTVGDIPVVVFFDDKSKTALAFDRRSNGRTLTFKRRGTTVIDQQTRTRWNPMTARAISGKLKGQSLRPLPAIVSFTTAWITFHPNTVGLTPTEVERANKSLGGGGLR
jgi:hypothetical protein